MRGNRSGSWMIVGALVALGCPPAGPPGAGGPATPGAPTSAEAQAAARQVLDLLDQAMRSYEELLDVGAVVGTVDEAISIARQYGVVGAPAARACILRGVIHVWMGEKPQAIEMFRMALTFDPTVQVPAAWGGPDVRAVIEEANLQLRAPRLQGPPVRHAPVASQTRDHPVPVWIEIDPSVPVASVRLFWRTSLDRQGGFVEMRRTGTGWFVELPCLNPPPESWEYFITALGADGGAVATEGSAEHPFRVALVEHLSGRTPTYPDGSAIPACPAPAP